MYLHSLLVGHAVGRIETEDKDIVDPVDGPNPATGAEKKKH
jgi:hypothetical protein